MLRTGGMRERWPEIRDCEDGKKKLEHENPVMGLTDGLDTPGEV